MTRIVWAIAGTLVFLTPSAFCSEMPREFECQPAIVEGTAGQTTTVNVLTIAEPGITARRYSLTGKIRYEDVDGRGYLEMWSHFPGRGQFFSKTLGTGPMQPLSGSSEWRQFSIPFLITDTEFPTPEKLDLNVVLPGGGRVELETVHLQQFGENEDPTLVQGQWWSDSTAGLVGGLAGALIGCLGGLIGTLSSRGRGQRFVLGLMRLLIVIGAVSVTVGLYALAMQQPYAVYYPLLLLGGVTAGICGGLYKRVRGQYAALELRKMQAQDYY